MSLERWFFNTDLHNAAHFTLIWRGVSYTDLTFRTVQCYRDLLDNLIW